METLYMFCFLVSYYTVFKPLGVDLVVYGRWFNIIQHLLVLLLIIYVLTNIWIKIERKFGREWRN